MIIRILTATFHRRPNVILRGMSKFVSSLNATTGFRATTDKTIPSDDSLSTTITNAIPVSLTIFRYFARLTNNSKSAEFHSGKVFNNHGVIIA
jgi:hypothetical protein